MNKFENELRRATNIARRHKEKRVVYLLRLLRGVNKLTDREWSRLSETAQTWANNALIAWENDSECYYQAAGKLAKLTKKEIVFLRAMVSRYGKPALERAMSRITDNHNPFPPFPNPKRSKS